jgi:hypothetical protein
MRPALVVVLVGFLLCPASFAEVPSIIEGSAFEVQQPEHWHRVFKNQSASSLVAFRGACHGPKGGRIVLHDALLYTGNHNIHPGESIEVTVADPSECNGSVEAAIFSDGHIEGDPHVVDRDLFSSRRGAYKALEYSIQLLNSVYAQHVPVEHVIDSLEAKRQSSLHESTEASGGYTFILIEVLRTLRQPHVSIHVPSDDFGPKRPQPSIEDVMNANGLSRDEARVLVFTKRLEEWKSLLEGNLQLPR